MRRALRVLLSLLWLCAAGCERDADVHTVQLLALGTVVEITAVDGAHRLYELEPQLRARLADWGLDMYAYGEGELARANADFARGKCVSVSPRLGDAIIEAQAFERRHRGLFSAGLADLTRLWRLHEPSDAAWQPPSRASIDALVAQAPRALNLILNKDRACPRGAVALDVGGFAKGRIIDELLQTLDDAGIGSAIVNVGGDLKVRGGRREAPWRIAIRDPNGGALARIALTDGEAVFTSGNYERFREVAGTRYGHILDPRSGESLTTIASVTVLGRDAAATDAAATALYVAASRARAQDEQLHTLAPVADAASYVIVDTHGTVFVSTPMIKRVEFLREPVRLIRR